MPAAFPAHRVAPSYSDLAAAKPFASAEEAWFWTMAALRARREGARFRAAIGNAIRPCEPDDVVRCLDRLWRQRRVETAHLRVLGWYGERQAPPDPRHPNDRGPARLWDEAMMRLDAALRAKGIVGEAVLMP